MAWPPSPIATDKDASTPVDPTDHPDHHNELAAAINDAVAELGTNPSGSEADLTDRLATLDTTVAGKLDALTPWTADIDADGNDLVDVGIILVGKSTQASVPAHLEVGPTFTNSAGGTKATLGIYPVITHDTTGTGTYYGLNAVPQIGGTANITTIAGLNFVPTVSNSGTVTTAYGAFVGNDRTTGTTTTAIGLFLRVFAGNLSTVTTGIGIDVTSPTVGSFATLTTMIGLRITQLTGGTTKWGMQVGDYQSYHHGRLSLGGTTAPTYGLHLLGTAQDRGVIGLTESTATPTNPTASGACVLYMKADKLVVGYDDAGTMRYKYLDLTGTGVTWVHTTSAP